PTATPRRDGNVLHQGWRGAPRDDAIGRDLVISARGARLHDRARKQERRDRDQLTAQDHPVDVDRRTPVDLFAADHERAGRPRVDAESGADPGAFSAGPVAATATGASLDASRGDHGDAVLLVRVAEDALDADHVPGSFDRL